MHVFEIYNNMKIFIIVACLAACSLGLEFAIDIDHYSRWCFNEFIGTGIVM